MSAEADNRAEYTEVMAGLRHYSALRFAVFTLFVAVAGGLSTVAFGIGIDKPNSQLSLVARLAGVVVTFIFAGFEYLTDRYLKTFGDTAKELEPLLGFSLWSRRPDQLKWVGILSVGGFYLSVLVFWIWALCSL